MIEIGSYPTRSDAELAQSALAAAGILSVLSADDAGGAYPFVLAGVAHLLVDESDAEAAAAVLSGHRSRRASYSGSRPHRGQGADQGFPRVRRADETNRLGSRNPRDAEYGENPSNGGEMKIGAQSHNRDHEPTTARFGLAAFVVAELLCTGALLVWVFLL